VRVEGGEAHRVFATPLGAGSLGAVVFDAALDHRLNVFVISVLSDVSDQSLPFEPLRLLLERVSLLPLGRGGASSRGSKRG
jgi:hypothetical protein